MYTDFVLNGRGHGEVAEYLEEVRFNPGMLRPYLAPDKQGRVRRFVTINTGRKKWNNVTGRSEPEYKAVLVEDLMARGIYSPAFNATSLRKEAWINMDRTVIMAARERLRAWTDLEAASSLSGFDGMGTLTHEYEAMNDPGEAVVDMDPFTDGRNDAPAFLLRSVPLPVTHADFSFSERKLAASRNSGSPLDTTMMEVAGRRIGETVERTLIGTVTGVSYGTQSSGVTAHDGTSKVYGYTNFPWRTTKTDLNTPTGANSDDVFTDVIEMRELMYANKFYGPFVLYTSTGYDAWLDRFHMVGTAAQGLASGTRTLREAIKAIEGINDVRRLDYLTSGYQMILVQMTPDVVQAINAMEVTTVQWEEKGGLKKCFKAMCIKVPLLKAPYNQVSAIVHATTS